MGTHEFVINMLSIIHHNESYGYENNDKYRQKPKKNPAEMGRESSEVI